MTIMFFPNPDRMRRFRDLLTSSNRPLFNRAVDGYYNPGSTIKPLDAVAALSEGVIDSTREIFSPGYLLVPNPYNPSDTVAISRLAISGKREFGIRFGAIIGCLFLYRGRRIAGATYAAR